MGTKTYVNPADYVLSSTITIGEASYFDAPDSHLPNYKASDCNVCNADTTVGNTISLANEPSGPLKQHFCRRWVTTGFSRTPPHGPLSRYPTQWMGEEGGKRTPLNTDLKKFPQVLLLLLMHHNIDPSNCFSHNSTRKRETDLNN